VIIRRTIPTVPHLQHGLFEYVETPGDGDLITESLCISTSAAASTETVSIGIVKKVKKGGAEYLNIESRYWY